MKWHCLPYKLAMEVQFIHSFIHFIWHKTNKYKTSFHTLYILTRLGVPSIAGRLLKVIETCVYDLSLQTHTPLHYILGLSSQTLTPAKR